MPRTAAKSRPERRNVESVPAIGDYSRAQQQAADQPVDAHERRRDFLTAPEIERLLEASKASRNGLRDYCMILMTYRHGLRCSELIGLRLDDLNLTQARIWVARLKNGLSTDQPLEGDEPRAIKRYLATRKDRLPWVFVSERGQQLCRYSVNYIFRAAAKRAGLPHVWPHKLRHSCGHALADNDVHQRIIQDWMGHRDPKMSAHYSRIMGRRFEGLWRK
jgi:type 1 fimbriae regulatory protein FimB